ncbi:MAG: hypothetical protein LC808_34755 [Actinobacteria bacterium]|nr:hypothetical protein [Actinomycetota bacterium]
MTEPDFHFTWPTRLRPHPLLQECTPYNHLGGFRAAVEVVIFPKTTSTGYTVLTSRDYLKAGEGLDKGAATVRFNTDTIVDLAAAEEKHADPFSVIWSPETTRRDPQAVGQVHLIGPRWTTNIMREMVERSATVNVDSVLAHGDRLNGSDVRSTLRPAVTETGLVRSVGIPPGRLRVVSRFAKELLKRGSTLRHELVIAATVPNAVNETDDLECEIAVFPRGWVTMRRDSRHPGGDAMCLPVSTNWSRPQEGRTGLGSRYIFETLVSATRIGLITTPPPSPRPPSGRRGAEVRIRVLRSGKEVCRLHHPFWIDPRDKASSEPPSASAEELKRLLGVLNGSDVARATRVPVSTVQAWIQDEGEPGGEQAERISELLALVDRLAAVMDTGFIGLWLRKPLRLLDDERPLDVLARGNYKAVSRLVAALESPVAS